MYNMAVIGYGGMGSFHVRRINSLDDFNVKGIYDIEERKRVKATEDGIFAYDTLEALLADEEIETVVVAIPNNFHKTVSIQVLRAGKNVICEKPVMMNAKELEEVIAVSEETGKQFAAHQNRRWDEDFNIVKKVIEDGILGDVFYLESRVQGANGIPGDWRCTKVAGGGMLLDWGIHLIDQIMWMVDSKINEVYGQLLSVKFEEVDDNFKVLFRFENGLSALVEVDTYTFITLPRWHVSGTKGTLRIDDFACKGAITRASESVLHWEEGIVHTASGPTKTMAPRPKETLVDMELPRIPCDGRDYYKNFRDAHMGKSDLIVKPSESLRVMKVIDAIFVSGQENRSVPINF